MRALSCTRKLATSTLAALAVSALMAAPASNLINTATAQTMGKVVTTSSGLKIIDIKVGTGAACNPGQTCVMHYTGWLYQNGAKGEKFDSSLDRGQPFEFPLGKHQVIAGWDEGVAGMKVGGKRTLNSATARVAPAASFPRTPP
jgi:FKBP-type peptidyl-prolyl cis-trans isomerase FkpA